MSNLISWITTHNGCPVEHIEPLRTKKRLIGIEMQRMSYLCVMDIRFIKVNANQHIYCYDPVLMIYEKIDGLFIRTCGIFNMADTEEDDGVAISSLLQPNKYLGMYGYWDVRKGDTRLKQPQDFLNSAGSLCIYPIKAEYESGLDLTLRSIKAAAMAGIQVIEGETCEGKLGTGFRICCNVLLEMFYSGVKCIPELDPHFADIMEIVSSLQARELDADIGKVEVLYDPSVFDYASCNR